LNNKGFEIQDVGLRIQCLGSAADGSWFRVYGCDLKVWNSVVSVQTRVLTYVKIQDSESKLLGLRFMV